jgi:hypothetical protein
MVKIQQMVQDLIDDATTCIIAGMPWMHSHPWIFIPVLFIDRLTTKQPGCAAEKCPWWPQEINIAINRGNTVGQTNQARVGPQAVDWSSQVSVHIRVIFIPFQIIPCDKVLNPLLYCLEVRLQRKEWQVITRKSNEQATQFINTPLTIYNKLYCTKQKDDEARER